MWKKRKSCLKAKIPKKRTSAIQKDQKIEI
jgi:hypothetical protein